MNTKSYIMNLIWFFGTLLISLLFHPSPKIELMIIVIATAGFALITMAYFFSRKK